MSPSKPRITPQTQPIIQNQTYKTLSSVFFANKYSWTQAAYRVTQVCFFLRCWFLASAESSEKQL